MIRFFHLAGGVFAFMLTLSSAACINSQHDLTSSGLQSAAESQDKADSWQKIETNALSFSAPADMSSKFVRGTEANIWKLNNKNMGLEVIIGFDTSDFSAINPPNYKSEDIEIDGRTGKLFSFRNDKTGNFKLEYDGEYVTGVRFADKAPEIVMWASCKDEVTQRTAIRIFRSIKFK